MSGLVYARCVRAPFFVVARVLVVSVLAALPVRGEDAADAQRSARVEALTLSLASGVARGQTSRGIAAERRDLMRDLIRTDPQEALNLALPPRIAARFPAEIRDLLEYRGALEGELTITQYDHVDPSKSELRHEIVTESGKRISLHFASRPTALSTGQQVVAKGLILDHDEGAAMAIASGEDDVEVAYCCERGGEAAAAAVSGAIGAQAIGVLMVNFANYPNDKPYSPAFVQDLVFGQAGDFFDEASHGQAWLTGDVHGWLTLSIDRTCNENTIMPAADTAAAAAGVDLSQYNRIVYITPEWSNCGISGVATVGGSPSRAWINKLDLAVLVHELGHGFGLNHAKSLDCGLATYHEACSVREYGDTIDAMANTDSGHFSPFQQQRLGWIDDGAGGSIQSVATSGTYQIEPFETAPGAYPKALRIPFREDPATGAVTWLYLNYRQAIGFDSFLADRSYSGCRDDVTDGVVANLGTDGNGQSSFMLNMNIDACFIQAYDRLDWFNPALLVGESFQDADSGVVVSMIETGGGLATVQVDLGGAPACIPANPVVSIAPVAENWGAPGDTVAYTMTVENADSAACPSSTFALSATAPAGWALDFNGPTLALAPGAVGISTLSVTSAATAHDEVVSIPVSAAEGGRSGAATLTYVVSGGSSNNPPVATDDSAETTSDAPVVINVLGNDFDPDGDALAITVVGNPGKGWTETNSDGTITYYPGNRAKGSDSFSYTISDGADSASAMVQVAFLKGQGGGGKGGGKGGGNK